MKEKRKRNRQRTPDECKQSRIYNTKKILRSHQTARAVKMNTHLLIKTLSAGVIAAIHSVLREGRGGQGWSTGRVQKPPISLLRNDYITSFITWIEPSSCSPADSCWSRSDRVIRGRLHYFAHGCTTLSAVLSLGWNTFSLSGLLNHGHASQASSSTSVCCDSSLTSLYTRVSF
jgi:hypothetical protein